MMPNRASVLPAPAQQERWFVVGSGVSVLTLMAVAFVIANVVPAEGFPPSGGYPSPFESTLEIDRFFAQNADTVRTLGATLALLAVAMLVFFVSVARSLERTTAAGATTAMIALGAGVLASGCLMLSAILTWTLSRPAVNDETSLLRAVHDLTFLAGGPAHVMFVALFLAAVAAASLAGGLPRWLVWLAIVGAAVSAIAVIGMLWRPATYLLPVTRLLLGAWIFGASLQAVMMRRTPQALPRMASPTRGGYQADRV
jgi:hypothetical protein